MIKILKNLTRTELILLCCVIVLTCLQAFLDLTLPDFMAEITLLVQTDGSQMGEILVAGSKMLLCAFGSLCTSLSVAIIAARMASNFSFHIRSKLFKKVMSFSMKEVNSFSTASLITRTTNDVTQVQMLIVMGTQMLVKAPITAIWAIVKISGKNSAWSMVTIIAVAALICIVSTCLSLAIPKFKQLQVLTDNINRVSREYLDGLAVVRAYNAEPYQGEKFEGVNQAATNAHLFTARTMSIMHPSIQMINNGLLLAVYLVGAVIINQAAGGDKLTLFSDMVVYSSYAMQVIMSFMMLSMVFMMLPRAGVAAGRINEVLGTKSSLVDGQKEEGIASKLGEVEFKNVSFKYPDADDYVLKNITFTAQKGEVVALIGSTGCGKSTTINLIPRFYDTTEGQVLVNGVDVKEYTKEALNRTIGYVSQRAILFTGTVTSNVAFGDNVQVNDGDRSLPSSVEIAQAQDFVEHLDKGYEGHVAQGGNNFSGGQKQRLSIARAIYRNPEILIFDDSFSALDYKTDRNLRHTLNEVCKDSTRIIVGQRIGTIRDADKIIVLDGGEIVGIGTHKELLSSCDTYYQIATSQLSEEELNNA